MVKIDSFCLYTPIKVLLISLVISFVVAIIAAIVMPSHPTQHGEASLGGIYVGALCALLSVINSVLSYNIAFNLYKTIRDNRILCFISFYSPVFIIVLIVIRFAGISNGILLSFYDLLFSIPFIIPQTYYFVRFRKRLSTGEILEDFYITTYSDEDN